MKGETNQAKRKRKEICKDFSSLRDILYHKKKDLSIAFLKISQKIFRRTFHSVFPTKTAVHVTLFTVSYVKIWEFAILDSILLSKLYQISLN